MTQPPGLLKPMIAAVVSQIVATVALAVCLAVAAVAAAFGIYQALRLALPRLKAISLQDFYWKKDADTWKMQKCPLGQGMVDWQKFFSMVSAAKFTGPLSIHVEYGPQDALGAMTKDLEFARAQVQKAWAVRG